MGTYDIVLVSRAPGEWGQKNRVLPARALGVTQRAKLGCSEGSKKERNQTRKKKNQHV